MAPRAQVVSAAAFPVRLVPLPPAAICPFGSLHALSALTLSRSSKAGGIRREEGKKGAPPAWIRVSGVRFGDNVLYYATTL